ncbi:hypothetical protein [Desulfosporosinus meridiei]|uniref:hypothetical protein n=1 Tax=Desulfosporosinus meridiei TaxID=79209 RepID=UPI00130E3D83|nr:hypothetical protein [Desulfosporosinus meridiei]
MQSVIPSDLWALFKLKVVEVTGGSLISDGHDPGIDSIVQRLNICRRIVSCQNR